MKRPIPRLCYNFVGEVFYYLPLYIPKVIKKGKRVAIFTDSSAVIHDILKTYSKHPLVHSIQKLCNDKQGQTHIVMVVIT